MAKKSIERPGDTGDQDFPQPPDGGMDDFPLPMGHDDDEGFAAMPEPPRRGAAPGKGRAAAVETFPEGDDDEVAVRPVRRRQPDPEPEEAYSFGQDDAHADAFADGPEHHDGDGHGFGGARGAGQDDDEEGAFDPDPDSGANGHADAPAAEAAAAKSSLDRSKLVTWGAAGAMVLFTGFFGWKYVSSIMGFDASPPAQVTSLSPMGGMPQPKWASANQGMAMPQGVGGPPPGAPGQRMPPPAQQASLPAAPAMPQGISMKGPSPAPAPAQADGSPAMQAAPPLPGLSGASPMPTSSLPPAAMMDGRGRGDARPGGAPDPALLDRIDRLERRLAELSDHPGPAPDGDRLAALEQRVEGVEARAVAPTTPRPSIMPPTKPPVIQGWSLKGVQNGVAWLNGPGGFVEARVGTDLQGAGRVKSVARYDQDWVVMTDNGVILRK